MFRNKYHSDGILNTYKDKLVSNGFRQKEGVDYFDTYAPIAKTTTIRVMFALDSLKDQMDVKTTFLSGDIDKEIYVEQP